MSRSDLERLSKEELIELVLRLHRPEKTSRTSSKPSASDRKQRREKSRPGGGRLPQCLAGGHADISLLQRLYPQMQQRAFDPPSSYARQLLKDRKAVSAFADGLALDLPLIERGAGALQGLCRPRARDDGLCGRPQALRSRGCRAVL